MQAYMVSTHPFNKYGAETYYSTLSQMLYVGQNPHTPSTRNTKGAIMHCDARRLDVVQEKVCEKERSIA